MASPAGPRGLLNGATAEARLPGTPWRGFIIRFVLLTSALLFAYHYPFEGGGTFERLLDAYHAAYARAAGVLLRLVEPAVTVHGNVINARFPVSVDKGCDATEVKATLVAAMLAFPASWLQRLGGVGAGLALVTLVNAIRIASLSLAGRHSRRLFDLLHLDVWPAALVLFTAAVFLVWAHRVGAAPSRKP